MEDNILDTSVVRSYSPAVQQVTSLRVPGNVTLNCPSKINGWPGEVRRDVVGGWGQLETLDYEHDSTTVT